MPRLPTLEQSFVGSIRADSWDYNKNNDSPQNCFMSSNNKKWFICKICLHNFEISLNKISMGRWCPYCANKILCINDCSTCFDKSFASSIRADCWDYKKNQDNPLQFFKSTATKKWFVCKVCNHGFDISLNNISNGNKWCPYCAIPSRVLCENDCSICFNKSFASSPRATYWNFNKNSDTPRECFIASPIKKWFTCGTCSHEFETTLNAITTSNGWCSYCANQKKCTSDCLMCNNKSFAISEKAIYWNYKKPQGEPKDFFKSSKIKKWFNCDCGHEIEMQLDDITSGYWCGYCSKPPKILCINECKTCFNKSFASSVYASNWDYSKLQGNPREFFLSANVKKWFICEFNHKFDCSLNDIKNNTWCPKCKNKTETKLYDWLISKYPTTTHQAKFNWCKNIFYLPFDFVLENKKIIIELDGRQHFKDIITWKTTASQNQKNDKYKMLCALQNGYSIIRIYQPNVLDDTIDWQLLLTTAITAHENDMCVSYIAKDVAIYDNHSFTDVEHITY